VSSGAGRDIVASGQMREAIRARQALSTDFAVLTASTSVTTSPIRS